MLVQRRGDGARLVERGRKAVHLPVSGDQRPRRGQFETLQLRLEALRIAAPASSDNGWRTGRKPARRGARWTAAGRGLYTAAMLRYFRAFTKSWFGPAIMGALLVALTFLGTGGIRNLMGGRIANAVISAGSRQVTQTEFQKMFQRNEEAYQARTGQPFPLEQAIKEGADKSMLQELAGQTAYAEMLAQSGIRPSDEVVAEELKRQAESGKAPGSRRCSMPLPASSGRRPFWAAGLLAEQRPDDRPNSSASWPTRSPTATSRARSPAASGRRASTRPWKARWRWRARDVTYFVIPVTSVPPPKPTDAQLVALMQQHKEQLMLPERRRFTIVRFSAKAMAPTLTVDPKAVEQQFQARKAQLCQARDRARWWRSRSTILRRPPRSPSA